MKVTVTNLKAPWPEGAVVGSVVEIAAAELPGWAAGKCKGADADAEATHTWEAPAPVATPEPVKTVEQQLQDAKAQSAALADDLQAAKSLLEASEQENGELRARVEKAEAAAADYSAQIDAAHAADEAAAANAAADQAAAPAVAPSAGKKATTKG